MVGTMANSKPCKRCDKKIKTKKEKYVAWGTYDGKKVLEEVYFHFQCFLDWFNESVNARAQKIIKKSAPIALKKAMNIAGLQN